MWGELYFASCSYNLSGKSTQRGKVMNVIQSICLLQWKSSPLCLYSGHRFTCLYNIEFEPWAGCQTRLDGYFKCQLLVSLSPHCLRCTSRCNLNKHKGNSVWYLEHIGCGWGVRAPDPCVSPQKRKNYITEVQQKYRADPPGSPANHTSHPTTLFVSVY